MESRQDELKKDLDAAVQTRKELGSEYESELIDAFLSRIDARLDARVEQRVEQQLAEYGPPPPYAVHPGHPRGSARARWREGAGRGRFQVFSLVMAIPLSGIGGGTGGLAGLLVVWAGIVGVNVAATYGDIRDRQEERAAARSRRREGWE